LATPSIIISATNDSLIASTVAARYVWTYNGVTLPQTTRRIRVSGNGNYIVKAGTTQFCITPASAVFTVTSTQPLYNNAWATMATLNPTQFVANVANAEPIKFLVTDMSGKVVYITEAINQIILPALKSGMYIVKAQQGKNLFVNRIVVTQ
jgi:expansin (peptidoglycan-binding protein)